MKTIKQLEVFAAKQSILIAEDEEILGRQLGELLGKFFLKVDVARDGQDALELYRKNDGYDIVITDIRMPRMNGIELSQAIKSMDPEQKIVVISAHHETEYFIELINIGIDGFILKPVKTHQLASVLLRASEFIVHRKQFELLRAKKYIESLRSQIATRPRKTSSYDRAMEQVSQISQEELKKRQDEAINSFKAGKVSALHFIEELKSDPKDWESALEDIDEMMELGASLDSIISTMIVEGFTMEMRDDFLEIFESYRVIFDRFMRFSAIADALHKLVISIEAIDTENLDHNHVSILASMLESLAEDIQKFTTHIFVDGDAVDIHYLDDALMSNIEQICNKLEGHEEDGGELELF
ncbi:response regulator [Desulfurispirillum indicum]|uniref:Response regulator receiver n=1 Tax=Desulfurispirillum indicum (strain ATCC BAA-1389 / DSM 22839 / S5) TaxID=653733 RepID=E6W5D4_DESIS|nr:response regulator [Desulfurispirillum indicum]ADU64865.1 response regulator receiver [Desulfurispirillum indicum S5]UCZ56796.1 response regulator [Desulfurispirillum indicum]